VKFAVICVPSMKSFQWGDIDPEQVLKRLTLAAYFLMGCVPNVAFESSLKVYGVGPEDLASATLLRFLDPDDHEVEWDQVRGIPTMAGVIAYLKTVMKNDLIDMKKAKLFKNAVELESSSEGEEGSFISVAWQNIEGSLESPESKIVRADQHNKLIAEFGGEPELQELLIVQLDPEGYQAFTNLELANLLGKSVSEVENRKKRLANRLLKRQALGHRMVKRAVQG
jgi:hypothetical protein